MTSRVIRSTSGRPRIRTPSSSPPRRNARPNRSRSRAVLQRPPPASRSEENAATAYSSVIPGSRGHRAGEVPVDDGCPARSRRRHVEAGVGHPQRRRAPSRGARRRTACPARARCASVSRSKVNVAYRNALPGGVAWPAAIVSRRSSARPPPCVSIATRSMSGKPAVWVSTCHAVNGATPGRVELRQPAAERRREREPALLGEAQHRGRDDRLGDRREEADGVRADAGALARVHGVQAHDRRRGWRRRGSRTGGARTRRGGGRSRTRGPGPGHASGTRYAGNRGRGDRASRRHARSPVARRRVPRRDRRRLFRRVRPSTATPPATARADRGAAPAPTAAPTVADPSACALVAADAIVVTVDVTGGECANGPCGAQYVIRGDGSIDGPEGSPASIPAERAAEIAALAASTDWDAVRAVPFTGECPVNFDGQKHIYSFPADTGDLVFDSCEFDLSASRCPGHRRGALRGRLTAGPSRRIGAGPRHRPARAPGRTDQPMAERFGRWAHRLLRGGGMPCDERFVGRPSRPAVRPLVRWRPGADCGDARRGTSWKSASGRAQVSATNPRRGVASARDRRRPRHRARPRLADRRGDPPAARRRVGRDGRGVGRRAGDRPRPRLPDDPRRSRSRSARCARRSASATARRASPSPRPSRGASSSGSPEPRRVGRRGPAGAAYMAIGDHWRWFGRVVAERKVREGDPIVVVLEQTLADTSRALGPAPRRRGPRPPPRLAVDVPVFVRLFDRAVGPREPPRAHGAGAGRPPAGRGARRHDPAPGHAPRRPAGRRRPGPRRRPEPPLARRAPAARRG